MAMVGLDIGLTSIKVAVLDGTAKAPRLLSFHHHKLESDRTTRSLAPEDLADLLRSLFETWRVPTGTCVAAVSAASALSRELTVPFVRPDQIRKTIKFQAESVFHAVSIDDIVVDFYKLAEYGGERSRLLVVGVKKELLRERLETLAQADLDPVAMDLDAAALYTTVTLLPAAKEGKRILAVDLGGSTMKVVAVEGGQLRGLRSTRLQGGSIKVGEKRPEKKRQSVDDLQSALSKSSREDTFFAEQDEGRLPVVILDEEQSEIFDFIEAGEEERRDILEKCFLEIDRSLAAVRMDGPIELVVLTGGGAGIDGIEKAFGDHFGAPCERLTVEQAVPVAGRIPRDAAGDLDLFGAVAVGLALKGLGHDPAGMDFRKEEFQYQGKFEKAKRGVACALVLLFVLFFTIAYSYQVIEMDRLMRQQERIFTYQQDIYRSLFPDERRQPEDVLLALRKKEKDLKQKLRGFDVPDVVSALDMLRDISQGFEESGKKCLLKEMTLKQKSSMMRVEIENELISFDLKDAVNAKPRLVRIDEGRVTPDQKAGTVVCEFRISIRETEGKKKPPAPAPAPE